MKVLRNSLLCVLPLLASAAFADLTTDAAVGGALGGAVGGALGAEVGGREGAIVGAGVGAAAGTAITTKKYDEPSSERRYEDDRRYRDDGHSHKPSRFCPPGQAKKGNC